MCGVLIYDFFENFQYGIFFFVFVLFFERRSAGMQAAAERTSHVCGVLIYDFSKILKMG